MKLDRYVMRELLVPFIIGTVAVVLMFQANLLIYLFKTFTVSSIPVTAIIKLLLLKTPYFLNMTLPVGIALATSLAMSRLVRESELTAMRAAGASILRVIVPISVFGLLVGIGNFYLAEKVMPPAEQQATKLNEQLALLGAAPDFRANASFNLGAFSVNIGTVYKSKNGDLDLNDVCLFERPRNYEWVIYTAATGTYTNGVWTFPNARLWDIQNDSLSDFKSKTLTITQRIDINDIFSQVQPTEMSIPQLKSEIHQAKLEHRDSTMLEVSYHTRFSVPAACYIFAIVGPVFAIWFGRSGTFVGVLLSILMVLLYYNLFIISTEIFGRNQWVSPVLAAWLPNILFFGLALLTLRRLE